MDKDSGIYKLTEHSLYVMLDVLFNKIKDLGYETQIYETDFVHNSFSFFVDKMVEHDLRKYLYDNIPGITSIKVDNYSVFVSFGIMSVYFYMNNNLIMK